MTRPRRDTAEKVAELKSQYNIDFPKIGGVVKEFREEKKRITSLSNSVTSMEHTLSKLNKQFEVLVEQNTGANAMLQLMFSNQYGERLPSDIPISQLSKSDFERLKAQSLSPFKAAHLHDKSGQFGEGGERS